MADTSKYWSAWHLVKPCHHRCQAFTICHADTLGYQLTSTNNYSGVALNMWGLETKLRWELETVDRKRAQIAFTIYIYALSINELTLTDSGQRITL